jgi:hypothetical protein
LENLHFAGFGAFLASLGASLATISVVLATFGGASLAAFNAKGAERVRKLRIAGAQPGAKGADIGAVAANFDAVFVPLHGATHGATLFAFNQTGQTRFNTTFQIFHLLIFGCERIFTTKGPYFINWKLYTIF